MTGPEAGELRVAGFAGSLRAGSYNRSLLRAAAELAPVGMEIDEIDISGVPLFDADLEAAGDPPAVAGLKRRIGASHGLLIAAPEYNHGVAGVTKNAVDWLSRPPRASVLDRLPVGVMGASPGRTGTARGQSQLRQAFVFTNSFCLPQPEVLVAAAHEKFDEEGRLTDEPTRNHLRKFLEAFAGWVRLHRSGRP